MCAKNHSLFFLSLFPFYLFTQTISPESGSPYSVYGIGNLQEQGFGQNEGMGGVGIGLRSDYFLNAVNPAGLGAISSPINMIFNTGFNVKMIRFENDQERDQQRDGNLTNLQLWLRLHKRWAASLSITPFSNVGYNITANRFSETVGGAYTINYTGRGGLSRLKLGQAFTLTKGLFIGANVNFIFGSISKREDFSSDNVIFDFSLEQKTHLRDLNVDFGLQYAIDLAKEKQMVIGATFAPATNFFVDASTILNSAGQTVIEESNGSKNDFALPTKFGLGASLNSKHWTIAADIKYEHWKSASLNSTVADPVNVIALNAGLEIAPFADKIKTYYQSPIFRFGMNLKNNYLKISGINFLTWGISTGVGIPLPKGGHHVNLNYSFHRNGTLENNLFLESTHTLSVNFSLRDIWFVKRRFR